MKTLTSLLTAVALVTTASPGTAQVLVDAASIVRACEGSSSATITIPNVTVGTQADRILVVGVGGEDEDENCNLGHATAGATYGGLAMTLAAATESRVTGWRSCAAVFYLLNPPTGTADVTVTFPELVGTGVNNRQAGAMVIHNAAQQGPEAVATAGSNTSTNPVVTAITTVSASALVVDAIGQGNTGTFSTTQSGQTDRWQESCVSGSSAGSSKTVASVSATNMGWSHDNPKRFAHVLAAFAAAGAPPLTTTTTTSSTTTTLVTTTTLPSGIPPLCDVTFSLEDNIQVRAAQFSVDYLSAPGEFDGSGAAVQCDPKVGGVFLISFFDDEAERTLAASFAVSSPIAGPVPLATCDFTRLGGIPTLDDFVVTVIDAADADLRPVNVDLRANVSCLLCGRPVTSGPEPFATDCAAILLRAVGLPGPCSPAPCLCDVGAPAGVTASDTLLCLTRTVDQNSTLTCACDFTTTTSTTTTTTTLMPEECGTLLGAWGFSGTSAGMFLGARGVAIDSQGEVYVVDQGNQRVQVFDGSGSFLRQWGEDGFSNGQFIAAQGIAIDSADNVYVSERGNLHARVQKFDRDGSFLLRIGTYGTADSAFHLPDGVGVDSDGNIFVADRGLRRIQVFDAAGAFLRKWSTAEEPRQLVVDSNDDIYVSERFGVEKYDRFGSLLTSWGASGSADGQFLSAEGLAIDANNNVYVADAVRQDIQKFSPGGFFLDKFASGGTGPGEILEPLGAAMSSDGSIYVSDFSHDRVQVFTCP